MDIARIPVSLVLSLPLVGAYGIFAIGIVMIYRSSRMLNLAHGAMAMLPAYLLYSLVERGIPVVPALPLSIAAGAGLGFAVERVFVSRLRQDGATAQTVGTVAALGLIVALAVRIWGTASLPAVTIFPEGRLSIGRSSIQVGEIGLFVVMLVVAAGLYALVQGTDLGLMMRGTAESRLAASLMGVNPDRITSLTWAIGGALAALAGILLAAVTALHPYTLALQVLPAFIAALLGGLGSLPGALVGAAIVGATQGLVPVMGAIGRLEGAPQLFLAVLAIVVMATRGKRLTGADDEAIGEGRAAAGARTAIRSRSGGGPLRWVPAVAAVVIFPHLPFVPSSVIGAASLAANYAIIAVALVVLTGWVGQISLGHAALVGIGAYGTGAIAGGLGVPFPLSLPLAALLSGATAALLGAVAVRVRGLYLAVATLVFSWMASEFLFRQRFVTQYSQIDEHPIGTPGRLPFFDLTDRKTFFLVAAAVLAIVLFAANNIRDSKTGRAFFALRGSEMAAASLGIDVARYKLLAFVVSGAVAGAAGNLLMTDARAVTASQFTFNISLFYVSVAVVGGLTSLPGAVSSGVLFAALAEIFYRVQALGALLEIVSSALLAVVLIAYPGGLASLPVRFAGVSERLLRRMSPLLDPLRTAVARTPLRRVPAFQRANGVQGKRPIVGGAIAVASSWARRVAQAVHDLRMRLPLAALRPKPEVHAAAPLDFHESLTRLVGDDGSGSGDGSGADRIDEVEEKEKDRGRVDLDVARTMSAAFRPTGPREKRTPLVEAEHVTVRFGGLVAVSDVSLTVREAEIVGLIGPNGAGKTTLFNAVAGYNTPTEGIIRMYGVDVTGLPVHRRARAGVARTFQLIQLFRQLTVYENLLVATHVHNPTSFASHVTVSGRSLREEAAAVRRVNEILDLLDLRAIAGRRAGDLPFGVLRMVEVARALVTGFRVMMLDEPASGLDNAETDHLIEVLRFVRGLGVSMLLIEHDVRMVTDVSDYMYVLEQGRLIAQGLPEDIQRDPLVIGAYLGEPEKVPAF